MDTQEIDDEIEQANDEAKDLAIKLKAGQISTSKWREEMIALITLLYIRTWLRGRGVDLPSGGAGDDAPTVTLPDGTTVTPPASFDELLTSVGSKPISPADLANISLSKDEKALIEELVNNQIDYLVPFASELAGLSILEINRRVKLYLDSSRQAHQRAKVFGLADLPAYPCDGSTPCLGNCRCQWELEVSNDFLVAYWRLGVSDHCNTCRERAVEWNPYVVELKQQ